MLHVDVCCSMLTSNSNVSPKLAGIHVIVWPLNVRTRRQKKVFNSVRLFKRTTFNFSSALLSLPKAHSCIPGCARRVVGCLGVGLSFSAEAIFPSSPSVSGFPLPSSTLHASSWKVFVFLTQVMLDKVEKKKKIADHRGGSSGWSLEACHPQ